MTWGDARAIYRDWLEHPDVEIEDNILANPETRKLGQGKPDNEFVSRPGEFREVEGGEDDPSYDPSSDPESGIGGPVEFYLLCDEKDEAHALLRIDDEHGTLEYRGKDEWIMVTPKDDMPILDDYPYTQVSGQAVPIWDSLEDDFSKSNFKSALLDDVDE
jgi:hypothetical protein